jgi:replicative DNA helicase
VSVERELVCKILEARDLTAVADGGVTPAFFQSSEHREAFKYILEHYREYGEVPSQDAFLRNYPTYKTRAPEDSLQYYVDEISQDYQAILIEDYLVKATDLFDSGDIEEAKNTIAQCVVHVNQDVTKVRAVNLTENTEERLQRYREYAKSGGALKGITTGFSLIDYATGGMQPGQLFVFVGPPKAGKSTMLLLSAMFANKGFYRPLFIGFEMSNEEQEERHDAIRTGVSHKRLRDGQLSIEEFQQLEKMSRRLESMPDIIFTADATSTATLSGVAALIDKYKPDVVYIDGMYMMDDENGEPKGSPQALTNLTRGLKRMSQRLQIPFAISTQVLTWKINRKRGVTTDSIGYTSSFAQDADVLIGVEPTDDDTVNKIKILDGRNVKRMEIYVKWDWDDGTFEEVEDEEPDDEDAATRF